VINDKNRNTGSGGAQLQAELLLQCYGERLRSDIKFSSNAVTLRLIAFGYRIQ
jgi:hypothetical protein